MMNWHNCKDENPPHPGRYFVYARALQSKEPFYDSFFWDGSSWSASDYLVRGITHWFEPEEPIEEMDFMDEQMQEIGHLLGLSGKFMFHFGTNDIKEKIRLLNRQVLQNQTCPFAYTNCRKYFENIPIK